ncbi:unnamed protein product, partial [Didymodactylos carnosus]
MRTGRTTTCPKGDRKIPAPVAVYMTQRYSKCKGLSKLLFTAEDVLCRRCLEYENEFYEDTYLHKQTKFSSADDDDDAPLASSSSTTPRKLRSQRHVFQDFSSSTKSNTDSVSTNDSEHVRLISKEETGRLQSSLNVMLHHFEMSPVKDLRDRDALREKTNLLMYNIRAVGEKLVDSMELTSTPYHPNLTDITLNEADDLVGGMKKLFLDND